MDRLRIRGGQPLQGSVRVAGAKNAALKMLAAGLLTTDELALSNVRDDIVIRSLGKRAPVRRVAAATLPADVRSPATDGMLEILVEAAREYEAQRRDLAA